MEPFLPEHMREGMKRYLEHGIEPGSFMMAVLTNNLKEAFARADHLNKHYIGNIVSYCYNEIPGAAWGSPENVEAWMESFRKAKQDEN